MIQRPADWWNDFRVRRLLLTEMRPSLAQLVIHYDNLAAERTCRTVYSGFLLLLRDRHFWMTAGHVIDEIKTLISTPAIRIKESLLRDGVPPDNVEAQSIPFPLDASAMFSMDLPGPPSEDGSGFDFGMIALRPLVLALLKRNPGAKFLPAQDSLDFASIPSGGLYVLGSPAERVRMTSDTNLRTEIHCLPIEQLPECPSGLTDGRRAIYGRLVAPEGGAPSVHNIRGMSGGPVFAVEKRNENHFGFRLIGIQSAWHEPSRTVRISPMADMVVSIDLALTSAGL